MGSNYGPSVPLEVEKEVIVVPVEIDAYKKIIIFNTRIIKDND